MGKTGVLDRVAADLARGWTHPAIQRLSSLVAAYPHDLDLRRRLAATYRRVGDRIQAGRWDYLTLGADPAETRAFERAYPSPRARLYQLNWPYRPSEAATQYARDRLSRLVAEAEAEFDRLTVARAARRRDRAARLARNRAARLARDRADRGRATGAGTDRRAGWPEQVARFLRRTWPGNLSGSAGPRSLAARLLTGPAGRRTVLAGAVAIVAAAPFAVVGAVTVAEWIVH